MLQRAPGPESREGADLVFGQENNHPSSLPTQAVVKGGSILSPLGPSQGATPAHSPPFLQAQVTAQGPLEKGGWEAGRGGGGGEGTGLWEGGDAWVSVRMG